MQSISIDIGSCFFLKKKKKAREMIKRLVNWEIIATQKGHVLLP